MKLATVIAGPYEGRIVHIEAVDVLTGMSHCDLGDDNMVSIRTMNLRKWIAVERIEPPNRLPRVK